MLVNDLSRVRLRFNRPLGGGSGDGSQDAAGDQGALWDGIVDLPAGLATYLKWYGT